MRTEPIFDTHSLVKRLSRAGLTGGIAEEVIHAISEDDPFYGDRNRSYYFSYI